MDALTSLDDLHAAASAGAHSTAPAPRSSAPTMGKITKLNYSHDGMIDMIIAHPGISQNELAARFGYSPSWVSNVMAADAFQVRLAQRREEVVDPTIIATVEERLRGLVIRATEVIQEKLDKPVVSDTVALRALELGAKGLGLGGHAAPRPVVVDLSGLKDRLLALRGEVYEGQAQRVKEG